jgi:hypothetical protein
MSEKIKIVSQHLENDVFGTPKLILTDENGIEWVMSSYTSCAEGGQSPMIYKKSEDWYFNPKNKKNEK